MTPVPMSPTFVRPVYKLQPGWQDEAPRREGDGDTIATAYDLLVESARLNPKHVFAYQLAPSLKETDTRAITHAQLLQAVDRCAAWLVSMQLARRSVYVESGKVERGSPVAIFLGSDANIYIYILALTKLGNPYALFSSRLSAEAVASLCQRAKIGNVLTDERTKQTYKQCQIEQPVRQVDALPLASWWEKEGYEYGNEYSKASARGDEVDPNDCSVAIFHSSGSTGLPKPIFHCHRYLLGYAANHELAESDVGGTLSTLPLYHGFGLLAPCLSLSIGMTCTLPASTTIPTGQSTATMLHLSPQARRLFIVPATLGEMVDDKSSLTLLQNLRQVVVGGAPMKQSVGQQLASSGITLLNHFGVTEIGALAPIIVPPPAFNYDWRYLLVRDDLNIQLRAWESGDGQADAGAGLGLSARPFGWKEDFQVQDALEENKMAGEGRRQIRIRGRVDDLVVLMTGEKVNPITVESSLREHPQVNDAVVFGSGRFQVGVLIEATNDEVTAHSLWSAIEKLNEGADAHAQIDPALVVVTSKDKKPLARTPKGNPERKANVERFNEEIEAAYKAAERTTGPAYDMNDADAVYQSIELTVANLLAREEVKPNDDFFELGMDSFKALKLLRSLQAGVGRTLPTNTVYRYSTVARLVAALRDGDLEDAAQQEDEEKAVQASVNRALEQLQAWCGPSTLTNGVSYSQPRTTSIVITGSTGSLGSHLLRAALETPDVKRIYCLVRQRGEDDDPVERQTAVMNKLGVKYDDSKIRVWPASMSEPMLGLAQEQYNELVMHATHVIHNAWPVDFLRPFSSFEPHIDALTHLVELCVAMAKAGHFQPRLVFASSIAVVARYKEGTIVPEDANVDAYGCSTLGYAQAKLVCERVLAQMPYSKYVSATSVRIGQLTGAEGLGNWTTSEHMAVLVKSSKVVGALPDLQGTLSWLPVNRAGDALVEVTLKEGQEEKYDGTLHLENPARQSFPDMIANLSQILDIKRIIPWQEWLKLVEAQCSFAKPLMTFFRDDFVCLATGGLVLDTSKAQQYSSTLRAGTPLDKKHAQEYVEYWRASGFLS